MELSPTWLFVTTESVDGWCLTRFQVHARLPWVGGSLASANDGGHVRPWLDEPPVTFHFPNSKLGLAPPPASGRDMMLEQCFRPVGPVSRPRPQFYGNGEGTDQSRARIGSASFYAKCIGPGEIAPSYDLREGRKHVQLRRIADSLRM